MRVNDGITVAATAVRPGEIEPSSSGRTRARSCEHQNLYGYAEARPPTAIFAFPATQRGHRAGKAREAPFAQDETRAPKPPEALTSIPFTACRPGPSITDPTGKHAVISSVVPEPRVSRRRNSERGDRPKPAAPFIPPVWYRARPWDPPITNDAAWL
jgi:hypothetical protein